MDFSDKALTEKNWDGIHLSTQAISTLMVCLQKCLVEQTDITGILRELKFARNIDTEQLHVLNPPAFKVNFSEEEEH